MGNSSSLENMEPDPWWQPVQQHIQSNYNISQETLNVETVGLPMESIVPHEDTQSLQTKWHQREQSLGQTIQHLAEENMRISSARQAVEKKLQEVEAEKLHSTEELERLRNEGEKSQQVLDKLHAQIQSGREDRQMITSEMERIRNGFDAERETKEQLMSQMRRMKEEHEQTKRSVEFLNEQLKQKTLLVEKTMITFNQERKEKECLIKELDKLREELKAATTSLTAKVQATSEQQRLQNKEHCTTEESTTSRIRSPEALAEMERFQCEMSSRREARQRAMQAVTSEMERLRAELNTEREAREQATQKLEETLLTGANGKRKQEEALKLELEQTQQKVLSDKKRIKQISQENSRLQFELDNGRQALAEKTDELEKMQTQFDTEREQTKNQIIALKEVANICKEMLNIREGQVLHLKGKLKEIEASVTNKTHEKLSVDLRTEYETQMENIRSLKSLYEERMKLMLSEKEKLVHDSEEKSQLLDAEIKKSAEFEQQIADMKLSLEEKEEENSNLQIKLDDSHDKSHGLAKELTLINNLFTQMLIGNTATDMDLDRLTRLLQENHDLITDITIKEDSSEVAAALPKLLLDLINQVDSGTASTSSSPTGERNDNVPVEIEGEINTESCTSVDTSVINNKEDSINGIAVQDIALNLPKVWKVLMELLSHHVPPISLGDQEEKNNSCYKSIDTPSGPRLVISVSQTFLRLKDLILEKKSLRKELTHLKQLNGHLERKLNDQEHKLSMVSTELKKTWNVVDQMQTQHQKLHTHEKILRYELHEKRKMLNELKQELEYCREKWERARQKNTESEEEWKKLRKEFASRKKHPNDILNNSGESGFLDERGEDSCEDDDSSARETGQLDTRIGGISPTEDNCTSSPLETDYPQPNVLIDPSRINMPSPLENTEHILNEPQSELELGITLDSDTLRNNECSVTEENDNESTFNMESQLQSQDLCLNSYDPLQHDPVYEHLPDCRLDSPSTNCSTISIITLLKEQLAFFSRNLDYISSTTNDMTGEHLEALESIFSLPPIQIPTALNKTITVHNCFENVQNYNESEDTNDFNTCSLPSTSNSTISTGTSVIDGNSADAKTNDSLSAETKTNDTVSKSVNISTTKSAVMEQTVHQEETANSHTDKADQLPSTQIKRTAEEIAEARAERLKRLEEQCQQLYNKVTRTTHRSTALCNRLEELHEQFRGSESPPGSRNNLTQSPVNSIPGTPSFVPSSQNSTSSVLSPPSSTSSSPLPQFCSDSSSNHRYRLQQKTSNANNIPLPPPLPHELPIMRIPICDELPQTSDSMPTPPPLPHVLPSRRIPTSSETDQSVTVPTPPPFPQNLRGAQLPTCVETLNNASGLDGSANETTRQISNDVQRQEELPQISNSTNSTTEDQKH